MKVIRIDDVGASTKKFNQYSNFLLANFWFLKRMWPFKRWGPYEELTISEWMFFLNLFSEHNIKPIVAVTACWVDEHSNLIPFPDKFPEEADFLKKAWYENKIEVANHGLTHCVVGKHLPRFFGSNREYHREFWPFLAQEVHDDHVHKSQNILENYFERNVEIFVPPGNVWSLKTYKSLKGTNIRRIISGRYMMDSDEKIEDIEYVCDTVGFLNLHDRELKDCIISGNMKILNNFL